MTEHLQVSVRKGPAQYPFTVSVRKTGTCTVSIHRVCVWLQGEGGIKRTYYLNASRTRGSPIGEVLIPVSVPRNAADCRVDFVVLHCFWLTSMSLSSIWSEKRSSIQITLCTLSYPCYSHCYENWLSRFSSCNKSWNWNRMFLVQTPTLPPSCHQKLEANMKVFYAIQPNLDPKSNLS